MKLALILSIISVVSASAVVRHSGNENQVALKTPEKKVYTHKGKDGVSKLTMAPKKVRAERYKKYKLPNGGEGMAYVANSIYDSRGINEHEFKHVAHNLDKEFAETIMEKENHLAIEN